MLIGISCLCLSSVLFGQAGLTEERLSFPAFSFHLQFMAVVIFVSFAAALKYLQTRNADFLYASLFLVVNLVYFMRWFNGNLPFVQPFLSSYELDQVNQWISGDFWSCSMEVPLILLFIITYALFLISFFDLKKVEPIIYKVLTYGIKVLFGLIGIYLSFSILFYNQGFFQALISDQGNLLMSLLFLIPSGLYIRFAINKGIQKKTRYFWFFMIGTVILLLGPLILKIPLTYFRVLSKLEPYLFFEIAVLVEVAFFYQALSIKEDYFYEEKDRTQRELLEQKQANQALQITKLEADFKALKAQMNPHFIFNSLNSLKALIQEEKPKESIAYLVKFSSLVRAALENADVPLITLEEEVNICANYLAIEALRMPTLEYKVDIEKGLDLSFLEIPPFIVQPFIENALWHGLGLKEGPRKLDFIVKSYSEGIVCIVEDNGIGRERAQQMKKLNKSERKTSLGINNIKERLVIHSKIYQHPVYFEMTDKKDAEGVALGTKVALYIPA